MAVTWTVYSDLGGTSYTPLDPSTAVAVARLNWISQAWCILGLMFGKLGVAALILRLQAPAKWRTILIWTMCTILVIWDVIAVILIFAQCQPTEALWNPTVEGHCWSPWVVVNDAIAVSGTSRQPLMRMPLMGGYSVHGVHGFGSRCHTRADDLGATDATQAPTRHLRSAEHRYLVCYFTPCIQPRANFACSAFAMAIVKIAMLPTDLDRTADFVRTTVLLFVWNSLEVNVVIIAACMATIRPLIDRLRGQKLHSSDTRRRRGFLFRGTAADSKTGASRIPGHQSYRLSGKGPLGTSSSDEQWIGAEDQSGIKVTIGADSHQSDLEASRNDIHVTRQFAVNDQSFGYEREQPGKW